jgi:hypothetical protein
VAVFGRHKLHEGQKMICCRSLGTSAAMTAEEEMSRQYFALVYGASYAAPFSATIQTLLLLLAT